MTQSIQALREERTKLAVDCRNLVENFPKDDAWGDDEQKKYDFYLAEIEKIDANLDRHQKIIDMQAAEVATVRRTADEHNISEDEAQNRRELNKATFEAWMRGGISALSDEQRQMMNERNRQLNISNAMSTGTGSEGGYTTQNEFAPVLIEAMKAYGGMRQVAQIIQTDTGSQMDWPTTDATSEEGEIVGENASVAVGETTFGTTSLSVYKYSSKSIAVPFELLQDSRIDLEGHLTRLLSTRLGRITNKHYTVGTGTGQPSGAATGASVGKTGATGQTTEIIYDDIVDLEHSVDPAYRQAGTVRWMMHDKTLAKMKKLKDGDGRPIWLPSIAGVAPTTLLGHEYVVNQNVAEMAANAKSLLFGDFSHYVIRDVMAVQLFRMTDSKYTEKGQVGFLAFMRSGGAMVDVGGAVKAYQNSAT